jgi:hypothetical protein
MAISACGVEWPAGAGENIARHSAGLVRIAPPRPLKYRLFHTAFPIQTLRENERSSARRRRAGDYESSDRIGMMHTNRLDCLQTLRAQVAVNYSNSLTF